MKMDNKQLIGQLETDILLSAVKGIREFVKDMTLSINKEGLSILEIDPSIVCLTEIEINKYAFTELSDAETEITINTDFLYNLLKENKKEMVTLSRDDFKLYLNFSNGINSEMDLIKDEREKKNKPELNFNAEVKIKAKTLKQRLKHFCSNFESLEIELNKDVLTFRNKNSSAEVEKEILKNPEEKTISKYSTEYLKYMLKGIFAEEIVLKFNNEYPLSFEQNTEKLKIKYILAPRIYND